MRARAAVFDEIDLVGRHQQVARRDCKDAFRADAGRQQLHEFGRRARILVDADDRGALGADEEVFLVAKARDLRAFRLDALLVAALRIVAGLGGLVFERRAGFVEHLAVAWRRW